MQLHGRIVGRVLLGCALLVAAGGCRDRVDTAGLYAEDLGDERRPLTPVAVRSYSTELTGSAELRPIGQPGQDGGGEAEASDASASAAAADIQGLVADYNSIVSDKAWDELADYFVERQRASVNALIEFQGKVLAKLDELRTAVEAKAPDAAGKVDLLAGSVASFSGIKVTNIEDMGEGKAAGSWAPANGAPVMPGMNEIKFELVGPDWFLDWPMVDMAAAMMPMMETMLGQFDVLIQGINGGQIDANALMTQIDTMMAAFSGGQGSAEQAPSEGGDDSGEDEVPSGIGG